MMAPVSKWEGTSHSGAANRGLPSNKSKQRRIWTEVSKGSKGRKIRRLFGTSEY